LVEQLWRWHKEWGVDEVWSDKKEQTHEDSLIVLERIISPQPSLEACFAEKSQRDLLRELQTLEDLRKALESFEGCALKETALSTVFSDGNPGGDVMVVGEAPGAEEDRQGKPFVGVSGQLLDRFFVGIGLDRSKIYIANVIPWRPPGNRQPTSFEIEACLPFIERHISLVNPRFLLMVGGTATKALLKKNQGVKQLRGEWIAYNNPYLLKPIMALATFHPAYLLRSPGQKREVWKDFLTLKQKIIKKQEGLSYDRERFFP
jgi:DNA polymerase